MARKEGAKCRLQVVTELKNRGVAYISIACMDGLKGFPDAIESGIPKTVVQLCLVHMVRHSLNFVGWKRRKEVAADLRLIYTAATEDDALQRLSGSRPDYAVFKLFYLAMNNINQKWTMPIRDRKAALNRFTIQFD